ncbi:magnesium/cobalt transporter CorA [Candidatus Zixiibacteriota bacterium]
MLRISRKPVKQIGAAPGTLVHTGERLTDKVRISVIDYDSEEYREWETDDIESCFDHVTDDTVTWVNIDGLHDVKVIEQLGEKLNIHSLVLEDILHVAQRPKVEDHDDYLFVVLKMLTRTPEGELEVEHISLILGSDWVLSFQEKPGDIFDILRNRLRESKGRIRELGSDYLCYRLIDTIVDHYFILLHDSAERIDALEIDLEEDPDEEVLRRIYTLKHELLFLRKRIRPLYEAVRELEQSESDLVRADTVKFLSDVREHTFHVIDTLDGDRERVGDMLDFYMTTLSNRMNEVMKVLTIIATIFIPLTFIAGIYGMNFQFMPELAWKPAYFIALGVMAIVAVGMVAFFRRKKWF